MSRTRWEGSFGALMGLVEFAQEEMERMHPGASWSFDGPVSQSLRTNSDDHGIRAALDRIVMMRGMLADMSPTGPQSNRADQALKIAEDMMTTSIARAAAVSRSAQAA